MKILVSACLFGLCCRWDGRSKENEAVLALGARHTLIPYCPEIYGGLATPREAAELQGDRVCTRGGADVTAAFEKGAAEAVRLCRTLGCACAVLADRSPSCGVGQVYDGSFTGTLVPGDGLTARALKEMGLRVLPASQAADAGAL